ncbi:hypothetical protein [Clostridium sp. Ade.TY]|nr:hypothetical protein [Clostridium sp. Ade.TY]
MGLLGSVIGYLVNNKWLIFGMIIGLGLGCILEITTKKYNCEK